MALRPHFSVGLPLSILASRTLHPARLRQLERRRVGEPAPIVAAYPRMGNKNNVLNGADYPVAY